MYTQPNISQSQSDIDGFNIRKVYLDQLQNSDKHPEMMMDAAEFIIKSVSQPDGSLSIDQYLKYKPFLERICASIN